MEEASSLDSRVEVTVKLGSETYFARANPDQEGGGPISEQLSFVKEQTMRFLNDFIAKNSVTDVVPDDSEDEDEDEEEEEEEDDDISKKPPVKKLKEHIG